MYCLTDEQIEFIRNDIRRNGVEMEDLQLNLLDHVCCIVEQNFKEGDDFESFYYKTIRQFYKNELKEIEEETIQLLTFKNYYAMKKSMIVSGTFAVTAFITGSLFKIMHWPGASIMLLLGITVISLVFLPLMVLLKTKELSATRDKLVLGISALVGLLVCMSTLFAIFHWPGRSVLWVTTTSVSMFVLVPVYFFTGIRKAETKLNTITTTIVLVGATGLLFTMLALRAPNTSQVGFYTYAKSEVLLKSMQHKLKDTHANPQKDKLVADINNSCNQLKALVLQNAIGRPTIPEDVDQKPVAFSDDNLGSYFFNNNNGVKLLAELKTEVNAYNTLQEGRGEDKIPVAHSILTEQGNNIPLYNNLTLLNEINQMQLFLANAGNNLSE